MEVLLFYPTLTVLLVIALAVSCGALTEIVAGKKGFPLSGGWFAAGFFLGPIALIAAAGLPDLATRKLLREYLDRLP